ncbi:hypothetical protein ACFWU5_16800 [Nocardia sp. NPDC058640]|uniref:hypothetical protein n=1 Tax=Nocardia sp. NPDC058640 TaxID=3346571 RepID=UPI00365D442D
MSDIDEAALEASLQRALDEPMPTELKKTIAALIEPHTMDMYLKHGDVMTCIRVAFPVIRDWLAEQDKPKPVTE